jgi:protein-S-isoprenylcysteine O-methyltransferase Ste14
VGLDAALIRFGTVVFRYRDYLVPVSVAAVVFTTTPRTAADPWLDVVGVLVACAGQAIRVLVIGLAYIQRGGKQKTIAADRLVVDGIFAHSRNPLYVGNFLLMSGLMLIWNSPAGYALIGAVAITLLAMTRAEETFLRGKFGPEFDAYCARVPRFLPDLRGLGATLARFDFDWKRVLRKEYGTTFSWTTTVIVLLGLQSVERLGLAAARPTVGCLALVWLGIAVLWATARWMKKTKRLVSPD